MLSVVVCCVLSLGGAVWLWLLGWKWSERQSWCRRQYVWYDLICLMQWWLVMALIWLTWGKFSSGALFTSLVIFSQPSIYIDGWLYAMRMTSVICNVPVLSQNDSTYHHSVFTTWKWHPFATWTPSSIILVWGHHPLIGAKVFACLQNSRYYWNGEA